MGELAVRMPVTALKALQALLIPHASEGDHLYLIVRTDCRDLPLRDMASYLRLIDHIYGRLQPTGFRSYAMRPREHLRIRQVRSASIELVISETFANASPVVIVWLCVKYLPSALESLGKAYDSVQQGLLARENRKQIRRQMERDEALAVLPKDRRNELAALVEGVLQQDHALVPGAYRFSEEHVLEVELRVERPDDAS